MYYIWAGVCKSKILEKIITQEIKEAPSKDVDTKQYITDLLIINSLFKNKNFELTIFILDKDSMDETFSDKYFKDVEITVIAEIINKNKDKILSDHFSDFGFASIEEFKLFITNIEKFLYMSCILEDKYAYYRNFIFLIGFMYYTENKLPGNNNFKYFYISYISLISLQLMICHGILCDIFDNIYNYIKERMRDTTRDRDGKTYAEKMLNPASSDENKNINALLNILCYSWNKIYSIPSTNLLDLEAINMLIKNQQNHSVLYTGAGHCEMLDNLILPFLFDGKYGKTTYYTTEDLKKNKKYNNNGWKISIGMTYDVDNYVKLLGYDSTSRFITFYDNLQIMNCQMKSIEIDYFYVIQYIKDNKSTLVKKNKNFDTQNDEYLLIKLYNQIPDRNYFYVNLLLPPLSALDSVLLLVRYISLQDFGYDWRSGKVDENYAFNTRVISPVDYNEQANAYEDDIEAMSSRHGTNSLHLGGYLLQILKESEQIKHMSFAKSSIAENPVNEIYKIFMKQYDKMWQDKANNIKSVDIDLEKIEYNQEMEYKKERERNLDADSADFLGSYNTVKKNVEGHSVNKFSCQQYINVFKNETNVAAQDTKEIIKTVIRKFEFMSPNKVICKPLFIPLKKVGMEYIDFTEYYKYINSPYTDEELDLILKNCENENVHLKLASVFLGFLTIDEFLATFDKLTDIPEDLQSLAKSVKTLPNKFSLPVLGILYYLIEKKWIGQNKDIYNMTGGDGQNDIGTRQNDIGAQKNNLMSLLPVFSTGNSVSNIIVMCLIVLILYILYEIFGQYVHWKKYPDDQQNNEYYFNNPEIF
jgi:hypothetical protein